MKLSMFSRRSLGALVALLAIGITSGVPLAQASSSHARVTLTMWAWADRQYCPVEFMKVHPDIKVNYVTNLTPTARMTVLKRAGVTSGFPDVYFDGSENV